MLLLGSLPTGRAWSHAEACSTPQGLWGRNWGPEEQQRAREWGASAQQVCTRSYQRGWLRKASRRTSRALCAGKLVRNALRHGFGLRAAVPSSCHELGCIQCLS